VERLIESLRRKAELTTILPGHELLLHINGKLGNENSIKQAGRFYRNV
jgi:hypothetical protein